MNRGSIMKRPIYSPPDPFSISPFLALLPVRGSVNELERMTSSLFARYEKVLTLKKSLGESPSAEMQRRMQAEELMLKQVLDWLSVNTEDRHDR